MATPNQKEKQEAQEAQIKEINQAIASRVLQQLGYPPRLDQIRVIPLFMDRYRVNVIQNAQVTDSFFVRYYDGVIVSSDPIIQNRYRKPEPIEEKEALPV